MASAGIFYGKPDLRDRTELFKEENLRPFERLLTWAEDFETMTSEDREAYREALKFIGGIYKGIIDGSDTPHTTCRKLIAIPSVCPVRFADMIEEKKPRAMVMLAHVFASMKLIKDDVPWFHGIAERQLPKLYEEIPVGWRDMMTWPMAVARGEVEREPKETQIHDILAL